MNLSETINPVITHRCGHTVSHPPLSAGDASALASGKCPDCTNMQSAAKRAIDKLNVIRLTVYDSEAAHEDADKILCEFLESIGHNDVSNAWKAITPKWYA